MSNSLVLLTVACPEGLQQAANQLARVLGYGPGDDQTYSNLNYKDSSGNLYAVVSGLVSEEFETAASQPLVEPSWGADLELASQAQAAISFEGPATPTKLAARLGVYAEEATSSFELEAINYV